jgi:hypothetical protein
MTTCSYIKIIKQGKITMKRKVTNAIERESKNLFARLNDQKAKTRNSLVCALEV